MSDLDQALLQERYRYPTWWAHPDSNEAIEERRRKALMAIPAAEDPDKPWRRVTTRKTEEGD